MHVTLLHVHVTLLHVHVTLLNLHVSLGDIIVLPVLLDPSFDLFELDNLPFDSKGQFGRAVSALDVQIGFGLVPYEFTWKVDLLAERVERDEDLLFNIF